MSQANNNTITQDKFKVVFNEIPNVEFFTTNLNLPDINMTSMEFSNPHNKFNVQGDKVQYGDFSLTFKVDEDFSNYIEIMDWIIGIGSPQSFEQFSNFQTEFKRGVVSRGSYGHKISTDATVYTLTNVDRANLKIVMRNVFPVSLSQVDFTTMATARIEATAVFKIDWFNFALS